MTYALGAKVKCWGRTYVVRKLFAEGEHAGKFGIRLFRRSNWESDPLQIVDADRLSPYEKPAKNPHARECQICGRAIHAAAGLIAHHGYERPGDGFQTDSCAGARYEPYEISRDRIREVLDTMLIPQHAHKTEWLERFRADPANLVPGPEVRTGEKDHRGKWITHRQPIGPDHQDYAHYRRIREKQAEQEVERLQLFISDLTSRYEKWKPKKKVKQAS
jgi:hypothetical protein